MRHLLPALLLLLATLPATAAEDGGRVPLPVIDSGTAEQCVEPVEFMRRNHMELILHQRDETVHRGIRRACATASTATRSMRRASR
jgi:hypothetical protein